MPNNELVSDETENFIVTNDDSPSPPSEGLEESVEQTTTKKEDEHVKEEITSTTYDKEVVREREGLKRQIEALQRENTTLKKKSEQKQEPDEADFDTYEEYLDALAEYDEEVIETEIKQEISDSEKTALAIISDVVNKSSDPEEFRKLVCAPDLPITKFMVEAISECDDIERVLRYLADNKNETMKIAQSSHARQARAIAKIEMTLSEQKPEKPTKVTKAPAPIDPVKGSDSQQKAVQDMSFSEYEKFQNEREKRRNRF